MRRRDLAALALAAYASSARGQSAWPLIGFLHGSSLAATKRRLASFHQGLAEAGFVEGRNVAIEYRWAEDRYDRLPALAAELIARKANVICAVLTSAAQALMAARVTTPGVFVVGADPVEAGLVASFSRPGGTMTGVAVLSVKLMGKRLELLRALNPRVERIGLLLNPSSRTAAITLEEVRTAARLLELQVDVATAKVDGDLEPAFAALSGARAGALLVAPDAFFLNQRAVIAALAARHALAASYAAREYVEAGGLMAYGVSIADAYRQAGVYVGRIIRGERPADLPVLQPTRFELVINMKAARALGLTIPSMILAGADEIIE